MKKRFFKVISAIISLVLVSNLCACLGVADKVSNTEKDVELVYWISGWGETYINEIVKRFNEKQSEYTVTLQASPKVDNGPLYNDPKSNTVDLYMTTFEMKHAYTQYLEPLNDVLDYKPDGENGLTIRQKLGDFSTKNTLSDGNLYFFPWLPNSETGIVYNVDLFKDKSGNPLELPYTTNDLIKLNDKIVAAGNIPYIFSSDYWNYIIEAWTAQYEGYDKYNKLWKGIYIDSDGVEHSNDVRILSECEGRKEAYKVLYQLISKEGYAYTNTDTLDFSVSQYYFMEGTNKVVFNPNGSWVENETGEVANVKIMKMPVLSSLGTKLGITESELKQLVKYVDGELSASEMSFIESSSFGTTENIDRVREARSMMYIGNNAEIVIPNYSIAKDGAKEFLKYYFSDEAMEIVQKHLKCSLTAKYSNEPNIDTSSWSSFMKDNLQLSKTAKKITVSLNDELFYKGGINLMYKYNAPARFIYKEGIKTTTVDEFWNLEKTYWETKWSSILRSAGIQ